MQVSRCRFWWCSRCKAVFEKEDLQNKIQQFQNRSDLMLVGTRTCGHCQAIYQLRDIFTGRHDVPRMYWGQLQQPVELPMAARSYFGSRQSKSSPFSVLMGWLLCLVALAGGAAILAYVLVLPLLDGLALGVR